VTKGHQVELATRNLGGILQLWAPTLFEAQRRLFGTSDQNNDRVPKPAYLACRTAIGVLPFPYKLESQASVRVRFFLTLHGSPRQFSFCHEVEMPQLVA